jgi:hypothetical protein
MTEAFFGVATYYVLTLAYSLSLKRRMVIDVTALHSAHHELGAEEQVALEVCSCSEDENGVLSEH